MEFNDLTPEQQEMARACKTPEDVLALAKEDGIAQVEGNAALRSNYAIMTCIAIYLRIV